MLTIYTTPGCTDCNATCKALTRRGMRLFNFERGGALK